MLEFVYDINPIVLDVAVAAILVLVTFLGAIKGIKNGIIDFFILGVSLFLGFCPYTVSLKQAFSENILKLEKLLPAGSNKTMEFGVTLFTNFLSALALFLLFYMLLHVVKTLVFIIVRKKKGTNYKPKSRVGRAFSGALSFVTGSFLIIVMMFTLNNNLVGMKNMINDSKIVGLAIDKVEEMLTKKDKCFVKKMVIKIYNGDLMYEVDEELVYSFDYLDQKMGKMIANKGYFEDIEDTSLTKEETIIMIKDRINDLNHFAIVSNYLDEEHKDMTSKFNAMAEEWLVVMNRVVKKNEFGRVEYTVNEYTLIRQNLENAGLKDTLLTIFDETVVGK